MPFSSHGAVSWGDCIVVFGGVVMKGGPRGADKARFNSVRTLKRSALGGWSWCPDHQPAVGVRPEGANTHSPRAYAVPHLAL